MKLTISELQSVNGIGPGIANTIYDYIHNAKPTTYHDILQELNNPKLRKDTWSELGGII